MDVREKLVELLKSVLPNFRNNMAYWGEKPIYEFADCLLAHGVTVQSERMVDAVPVVRCKDCIYSYEEFGFIYCTFEPYGDCKVPSQFYCAEGKRKEDK